MAHYKIVQALEAEPSKIGKEQIVFDAFMKGEKEFFIGASLCYDVLITFGISSKIPGILTEDLNPQNPGTFTFSDFLTLTTKLRNRELTGHAARDAIIAAAESCHGPSWNDFYRRVLQKDLRCGATDGTINRVLKKLVKSNPEAEQLMVPVFECQLAEDGMKPVHMKKQTGRMYLDPKFDGCLSGSWEIEFEDGSKVNISDVVEKKIEGKVKAFDVLKNKIVYKEIKNFMKNGIEIQNTEYEWFSLTLENGEVLPPITGNHLIYLPELKCWRRIDQLKETDILLID